MSLTAVRTQTLFIFAFKKTKHSTFSANRHVLLPEQISPAELNKRSLGTLVAGEDR